MLSQPSELPVQSGNAPAGQRGSLPDVARLLNARLTILLKPLAAGSYAQSLATLYVYAAASVSFPLSVATYTLTRPFACAPVWPVIVVELTSTTFVSATPAAPSNFTTSPLVMRFVPVIVTPVPSGPLVGLMLVTVGASPPTTTTFPGPRDRNTPPRPPNAEGRNPRTSWSGTSRPEGRRRKRVMPSLSCSKCE